MLARLSLKWPPTIFYGWYIIGVAVLGGLLGAGTSQLFMGLMLKPITREFGWSRTAMSGAITAGSIAAGVLALIFGKLADRYGPRLLTTVGGLVVAGSYFALANVAGLWQFYVVYIVGRAMANSTLGGVVPMTAATNWFRRKRGRALGLVAMSLPLGGSVLAIVGQLITGAHGWRTMFAVFGVATLVVVVVPAAVVLRRRPEDMGLRPDGDTASAVATQAVQAASDGEVAWSFREAVRTPTLWLLIAGLVVGVMANGAVGFHQVAYYSDVGISATVAAAFLSVYALSGATANALWGFLTERFSERHMAFVAMLLAGTAVFYLLFVRTSLEALLFSVLFGLAARGESALVMMIVAQYYGRRSYGTISGFMTPFQMVGLGLGPLVSSVMYDLTGSYRLVFMVFSASYVVAAVLLWLAKRPAPRARLTVP